MSRQFSVLLVDDDLNDRLLFSTALQHTGLAINLFEATDGYAAIAYLNGHPPYDDRENYPFPDLVFLDLKMPGIDGFGVLKYVRGIGAFKHLPVIVFSNSSQLSDMKAAFALGANAYHQKPAHYNELVDLLRAVLTPWQELAAGKFGRRSAQS